MNLLLYIIIYNIISGIKAFSFNHALRPREGRMLDQSCISLFFFVPEKPTNQHPISEVTFVTYTA